MDNAEQNNEFGHVLSKLLLTMKMRKDTKRAPSPEYHEKMDEQ